MKRILYVWLPGWPLQRLRRARPELNDRPLVLYAAGGRGKTVVAACCPAAARLGVAAGMPLAEARAVLVQSVERGAHSANDGMLRAPPSALRPPHFEPHDSRADRAALRKLALWCQRRFSPLVALEDAAQPDSLFLDITGCGALFGGEEALAANVVAALRRHGLAARAAVADTPAAAWAVAHYAVERGARSAERMARSALGTPRSTFIILPNEQAEALRSLPIEALRLPAEALPLLHALDIRRIGQLMSLPRADLPARFGPDVVRRLDQALGHVAEVLIPERGEEPAEASWLFEPPTADRRALETVLAQLLEQVLGRLRPRQLGVQRLLCSLWTTANEPVHFVVGLLGASVSAGYLLELVRLHFERVRVPAEVTAMAVRAAVTVPLEFQQGQIYAPDAAEERWRQFPALIERLSSRLGEQSVLRPRLWPDAQPEFACRYEPWLCWRARAQSAERRARSAERGARSAKQKNWPILCAPRSALRASLSNVLLRPPCLKARPVAIPVLSIVPGGPPLRFEWQGRGHVVAHYWGPERIETGWWRGRDVRRDYYLVEAADGERFWLFRALVSGTWFLHGTFT